MLRSCFRFLAKLANGKVRIEATDWPSFLYDPTKADPDDVEQGLFTGDFLLNVCHHFYLLVSSLIINRPRYSTQFSSARVPRSLASSAGTQSLIVMV